MSLLQHKFAEVNGLHLHYVIQGNGPRLVVLLHGWPEFWYSWRFQLAELSKHYTVVAPDLRGFNLSDKPEGVENYRTSEVIKDVQELIRHIGFDRAVIVGHDWGGAVAYHFATAFPEMTEKLAILNCPHPKILFKHFLKDPSQLAKSWYMLFFQLPKIPELIIGNMLKTFFESFPKDWMYRPENMNARDIAMYVNAYQQKDALTSSINYYRAGLRYGIDPDLKDKKVEVPVRVIWGVDDKALNKSLNDDLHLLVSGPLEIIYIENCGHWVQNDQPERVNELLLEFIG
jgi:pimeloyl-ACP methyl ester carboxylesterase